MNKYGPGPKGWLQLWLLGFRFSMVFTNWFGSAFIMVMVDTVAGVSFRSVYQDAVNRARAMVTTPYQYVDIMIWSEAIESICGCAFIPIVTGYVMTIANRCI